MPKLKPGIHPLASVGNDPEHRTWLSDPDAETYSCVIDPTAQVNAFVTVDNGTWRHTTIGANTLVMAHSHVGHDVVIGEGCDLAPGTVIGGSAELGNNVKCGINSTVLPFRKVGDGAIIGAGAVVTKNVEPGAVVVGNPAMPIGARDPKPFSERSESEASDLEAWRKALSIKHVHRSSEERYAELKAQGLQNDAMMRSLISSTDLYRIEHPESADE